MSEPRKKPGPKWATDVEWIAGTSDSKPFRKYHGKHFGVVWAQDSVTGDDTDFTALGTEVEILMVSHDGGVARPMTGGATTSVKLTVVSEQTGSSAPLVSVVKAEEVMAMGPADEVILRSNQNETGTVRVYQGQ